MPQKRKPKVSPVYKCHRDMNLPEDIADGIANGEKLEDYPHCPVCGLLIHGDYGYCIHAFAITCEGEWSFMDHHPAIDVLVKQLEKGLEKLSEVMNVEEDKPKNDKTRIPGKNRTIIRRFLKKFTDGKYIDDIRMLYQLEKILVKSKHFAGAANQFEDGGGSSSDSCILYASNCKKMATHFKVELKKLTSQLCEIMEFTPETPAED